MTKFNFFLSAFLILFAMSVNALAGDYANLNFIGFSKDGKFLAFEEYGTGDGSGYPYSNIYFINTEKNAHAAAPVTVLIERETATERQARNRAALAAAKKLRELKIVKGNTGTHTVSRLITDLTYEKKSNEASETVRFAEIVGSMYHKGDYELTLQTIETKTKECEPYEMDIFKFELTLKDRENDTTRVLQKDKELPKSRGCAIEYRIQDVYLYENTAAVFINVFTPGFEGPDMRFMVVTGNLAP